MPDLNVELTRGFILDLSPDFYAGRTEAELRALGYTEEQIPAIAAALARYDLALAEAEEPAE
jgi:hypothetical protein